MVTFIFSDFLWSQTPSSAISFEERVYDFGNIVEKNGKVSHTFVFHNNGKEPVVISNIYSGCGCIGQVVSKDPVKPGGKGTVAISFSPEYKSGFFSKEVIVYSNKDQNYNRIWVQGTITPSEHPIEDDYPYNFGNGLYLRLKVMAFGYLKPGETKQMNLHYANDSDKPILLNFVIAGNAKGLKFANPGKIPPKGKGLVAFAFTMPASVRNDAVFTVYPYVNNKKLVDTIDVKILNEINLPQKRGKAEKLTKKEPSGSSPKIRLKSLYDVVTK
jgi:hypothetical protein